MRRARIAAELDERGCATTGGPVLTPAECAAVVRGYDDESAFRSHIIMARHGFGRGEYRYFACPLPAVVAELRATLYARVAEIATRWEKALGRAGEYPAELERHLGRCHRAGQRCRRPPC